MTKKLLNRKIVGRNGTWAKKAPHELWSGSRARGESRNCFDHFLLTLWDQKYRAYLGAWCLWVCAIWGSLIKLKGTDKIQFWFFFIIPFIRCPNYLSVKLWTIWGYSGACHSKDPTVHPHYSQPHKVTLFTLHRMTNRDHLHQTRQMSNVGCLKETSSRSTNSLADFSPYLHA